MSITITVNGSPVVLDYDGGSQDQSRYVFPTNLASAPHYARFTRKAAVVTPANPGVQGTTLKTVRGDVDAEGIPLTNAGIIETQLRQPTNLSRTKFKELVQAHAALLLDDEVLDAMIDQGRIPHG